MSLNVSKILAEREKEIVLAMVENPPQRLKDKGDLFRRGVCDFPLSQNHPLPGNPGWGHEG
jgi:hypothetical protein